MDSREAECGTDPSDLAGFLATRRHIGIYRGAATVASRLHVQRKTFRPATTRVLPGLMNIRPNPLPFGGVGRGRKQGTDYRACSPPILRPGVSRYGLRCLPTKPSRHSEIARYRTQHAC